MRYRVFFEQADNEYYQIIEAESKKQARGRFAKKAVEDDDFTFIEAIKLITGVEEIKE